MKPKLQKNNLGVGEQSDKGAKPLLIKPLYLFIFKTLINVTKKKKNKFGASHRKRSLEQLR